MRDGGSAGNYSAQNAGDDHDGLHDPDMQWNKFGSKNNSMIKNHNKSSQLNNEMNGNSTMRHMPINDKIDGVHDRRNKYLANNNNSIGSNQDMDATSMERTKPYSKHLVPLSPSNGSSSRGVSNGA